jgi:hypothetical protein
MGLRRSALRISIPGNIDVEDVLMTERSPRLATIKWGWPLITLAGLLAWDAASAQQADERTLIYSGDGLDVRWHLQLGLNAVSERDLFWNFSETIAPSSGFDPDADWLETYIKPGLSFDWTLDNGSVVYGKVSGVASYTAGTDAFDAGDTGRITLEEGYLGYRTPETEVPTLDVSLGPRELKLGSGMLIANGGSSGFERGALKFGPRKAWENAVIGRLSGEGLTGIGFYLDPNELPSSDGKNEFAGFDLRYDDPSGGYFGGTYLNVLHSNSVYPQAAPGGIGPPSIIPGGREGTNAINLYGKTNPFDGPFEQWFLTGDFAYEWNDAIDMSAWAGRIQIGYSFENLGWSPLLTYSYQTFSGDDPDTTTLERFDPLYYEGSPGAWATGSKSSMVFINSNVQAHEVALRLSPTESDTITLRYTHIRANELDSPVQFGQATRVETSGGTVNVVSGVADAHLSDDVFLEYSRVINRNTFLTAGVSVSFPGKGIREVVGGDASHWVGGFVNVVVNF